MSNSDQDFMKDFTKLSQILVEITGIMTAFFIGAYVALIDEITMISLNFFIIGIATIFLSLIFSILGAIVSHWNLLEDCPDADKKAAKNALTFVFCYIPIINLAIAIGSVALVFLLEARYFPFFGWYTFAIVVSISIIAFYVMRKWYIKKFEKLDKNRINTTTLLYIIGCAIGIFVVLFLYFKYNLYSVYCLLLMIILFFVGILISLIIYKNKIKKIK